jgi:hypothetical protein
MMGYKKFQTGGIDEKFVRDIEGQKRVYGRGSEKPFCAGSATTFSATTHSF